MNLVILNGRLCADPDVRYTQGEQGTTITRFRLAVNRPYQKDAEQKADFINCVSFGKNADNIGKYFKKGSPILVQGRIQTGNYKNKDGATVYTTDIIVAGWEFVGGKADGEDQKQDKPAETPTSTGPDDFVPVPDDMDGLPFN